MKASDLKSPGQLHNSQTLRVEVAKALSLAQNRKDNGSAYDSTLETFLSACITKLQSLSGIVAWDGTPKNLQLVELGDSFIAMGGGAAGYENYGIVTAAQRLSGQRLRRDLTRNFGKGGDSSQDALARLQACIDTGAGFMIVHLSTNDGTTLSVQQTMDNLKTIRDLAFANRVCTIFVAPEPRGNDTYPDKRLTGTVLQYHLERRTRMLAELPQVGCRVIDVRDITLAPGTDNDIQVGYSHDGLHPNTVCAEEAHGPRLAAAITAMVPTPRADLPSGTTARSKNVNVECAGASTTSDTSTTPPTSYTGANGTGTTGTTRYYKEVTTATGRWCRVTIGGGTVPTTDSASLDLLRQPNLQGNLVAGKVYEVVCEYEIDAGAANILSLQCGFQAAGSSTAQLWDSDKYQSPVVISSKAQAGWFCTPTFTAADVAGLTDFRIRIAAYVTTGGAPAMVCRIRNFELREFVPA